MAGTLRLLQALKGHVQEYPGCQSFDVFVRVEAERRRARSLLHDLGYLAQLEAFLGRGYTFERLLADLGDGLEIERSLTMEKVF